jgi:hypothetical protein
MKKVIIVVLIVLLLVIVGSTGCNLVTPKSTNNHPPRAFIDFVSRENANMGVPINFEGHGTDVDGTVVAYNWRSNNDGDLSTSSRFETSSLSPGEHTIYFKVRDNAGVWSAEAQTTVNIFHTSMPASSELPVINAFYATPATISKGQSTTLSWEVSNATSVVIQPKIGNVASSGSSLIAPDATISYSITATNASATISTAIIVTVTTTVVLPFNVTKVATVNGPATGNRPCPATLEFNAEITTDGPGTVTYRWERSDGVKGATQTLTYYEASTQTVTYNWAITTPGIYSARVRTLTPKELVSLDFSTTVVCKAYVVTELRVVSKSASGKYTCPTMITFTSSIKVDGPCTVTYFWVRSDGVNTTRQNITFKEEGTQTQEVTYSWEIEESGAYWARLHTLTPNVMQTPDYATITIELTTECED